MTLRWFLVYCVLINLLIFIWYAVRYDENGSIQLNNQGVELLGFKKHSMLLNEINKTVLNAPIVMIGEVSESEVIKVKITKD